MDGSVLDFTSELNLSGAVLTTNPPTVSVVSDSAGYFIFKTIDVGDYNLIARKNGYVSESVAVSVQKDKSTTVVVLMERSSVYNDPPVFTGSFTPGVEQTNQPVDLTFSWTAIDPNPEDSVMYDVVLYESNQEDSWEFNGLTDSTLYIENLRFNTVYFWQVTASDPYVSVNSELLSFKTMPLPDNEFRFARKIGDGFYDIYSANSVDSIQVHLTRNTQDEWQPRLSPLRDKVAYVSHYNLEPHIFTMNTEGTDQNKISRRPITGYQNPGRGLAWTADGERILYANYNRLSFIQQNGTVEGVITTAPANRHFRDIDCSPDGNMIVALTVGVNADDSEIYLMNSDGSNPIVLVNNLAGIIEGPTFSIDSKKILYTRDVSGYSSGTNRQLDAHIFTIDINTLVITDLSIDKVDGTNDTQPRFSPNGAEIIFENASNAPGSAKSLWTMSSSGEDRKEIIKNAEMPDWR
ncbi:MAG: carboxypeptidase-like regulatory domain-containing protein [Bacteroidales bacterium]|nr:carboxypeptidase-like regulatory domain-containing protein [Bacteroidales bacterium]